MLFGGEVGEDGCGEGVFLCFSSRCSDLLSTDNKLQQSVYAECFDSDNNWWLTSLSLSQPVRFLFFHPISPVLLRRGSESMAWWSWAPCCQITTVCASGSLYEDSTIIFKEIWTVGCLRRELRDWWEQHSGKCSCKNMKLFPWRFGGKYWCFLLQQVLGMCKWRRERQGSLHRAQQYFWRWFVKACELYYHCIITDPPLFFSFLWFFFFLSSFPFWQLKSGWENFSLWLPPFLIFCSSWNKNTWNSLCSSNTGKSSCHLCRRLQHPRKLFLCCHYLWGPSSPRPVPLRKGVFCNRRTMCRYFQS